MKFAVKYNEEAHRLLAAQNPPLAPTLYSCARVIDDMYMVVMEYISRPRGWCLDLRSSADHPPSLPVPKIIRRDVTRALGLLHGRGFVFGGLREANLLYLPEDGSRVLLVDSDGVGLDGESRYSVCLDPSLDLGVKRWQIMMRIWNG